MGDLVCLIVNRNERKASYFEDKRAVEVALSKEFEQEVKRIRRSDYAASVDDARHDAMHTLSVIVGTWNPKTGDYVYTRQGWTLFKAVPFGVHNARCCYLAKLDEEVSDAKARR